MRRSPFPSAFAPILVVVLLAVGCADAPSAPVASLQSSASLRQSAATTVPFKGNATGQDVSVTFEATGIHIVAEVTGNATGIGRFTEVLDYMLAYDFEHFAGGGTITAADGAQLFLSFSGSIPGFAAQVFPLPYTSVYTITGGTGRFSGSTGEGSITGTDFGGGLFEFSFTGTRTP
jgi:hypothetical protein